MRLVACALAMCLATPAAADRAANFSASLVGKDADTVGVIIKHEAAGWTMKVRPKPGDEPVLVATPGIPSTHGDFLVFVGPGRKRIAWIMTGDVNGVPAAGDTVVWMYKVDDGSVVTTTFAQLFTEADRDKVAQTSAGAYWYTFQSQVKAKGYKLTMPATGGGSVVVDLKAGTVKRRR
jgi:hypothetical protein